MRSDQVLQAIITVTLQISGHDVFFDDKKVGQYENGKFMVLTEIESKDYMWLFNLVLNKDGQIEYHEKVLNPSGQEMEAFGGILTKQ